jgi:predicted nucleotidyltransferase
VREHSADGSELDAAVAQLVEEFHPTAIYLFGSLLEGRSRPESSVDLLVIAPDVASVRFLDRIKRAIKATSETLPNITPLVYTPKEVELLEQQGDGFMQDVLTGGKVLYQKK